MLVHTSGRRAALAAFVVLTLIGAVACSSKSDGGSTSSGGGTTIAPAADVLGPTNKATGTPIKIGYVSDGANASFGSDADQVATFDATVDYANEHLGGINGHEIDVEHCATDATPAGGTQCAVTLRAAGVAAVLVAVSAVDGALFEGLAGSGIPYFTYESADQSILLKPGAFLLTNPISQIAVPGLISQEQSLGKVGFILIDVPAATGPITAIAKPIYSKLGVELQIIPIAPSVADMTPQIQEAISGGAGLFTVTGTDDFNISGVNGLHQLGFTGPIVLGNPSTTVIDGITDYTNLIGQGTQTDDPSDPDVQLMHAVVETYSKIDAANANAIGFATPLAFVRALTGSTNAVDAASISAALSAMPKAELPLGGGITFQCGTAPVSFAPSICSKDILKWTYDSKGQRQDFGLVDVPASALTLG